MPFGFRSRLKTGKIAGGSANEPAAMESSWNGKICEAARHVGAQPLDNH